MKLVPLERISLKSHPQINEAWLQDQIAENPSILGLGDLELHDRERRQTSGGRLDLLLQNDDQRYEVELQLGSTDESHIIRTIEYWDLERKRFPQYQHIAVIVAEEITSRFFNVISLFNGAIPIIAMQAAGYQQSDGISLVFTKILEQRNFGLIEEADESSSEMTDRNYWINKVGEHSMGLADKMFELILGTENSSHFYFTKFYMGVLLSGRRSMVVTVRPRVNFIIVGVRTSQREEWTQRFEQQEPNYWDYNIGKGSYRFRFHSIDSLKQATVFKEFVNQVLGNN